MAPSTFHKNDEILTNERVADNVFISHWAEADGQIRVQTNFEHMSRVSELCSEYCKVLGIPLGGKLLGILHDIGKYGSEFQKHIRGYDISCDHSSAVVIVLDELMAGADENVRTVAQMYALASACHHSGLRNMLNEDKLMGEYYRILDKRTDKDYAATLTEVRECASAEIVIAKEIIASEEFRHECARLLELIGKYQVESKDKNYFMHGMLLRFVYSCLIDADRRDAAEFERGEKVDAYEGFEVIDAALDEKIANFEPSELGEKRTEIYNLCADKGLSARGIYELSVPTGGGKTFSSLKFALEHAKTNGLKRVIYVLPYISIIEQNADEVRKLLQGAGLNEKILYESHSSAIHEEKPSDGRGQNDADGYGYALEESWSDQIIFTTMVGLLESVYGGKTQNMRRFHNLAESVIIFDEIQNLPIKCMALFNLLVQYLVSFVKSSVMLCTATQPKLYDIADPRDKKMCALYNLPAPVKIVEKEYPEFERTDIDITLYDKELSYEDVANFAREKSTEFGSLLIVVNKKASALELYRKLKDGESTSYHLSTNMCAQHRLDTIDEIREKLKAGEKILVVSTQLIEAGVDLDFACVFRFMCGLDSVIQAAGRCNREGKLCDKDGNKIKGKVYLINCSEEGFGGIKEIETAARCTKRAINEFSERDISLKDPRIQEYYYDQLYVKNTEDKGYRVPNRTENAVKLLSTNFSARNMLKQNGAEFCEYFVQAFKTVGKNFHVINNTQIGVLVPYRDGKGLRDRILNGEKVGGLREFQRYFVNIYESDLEKYRGMIRCSEQGIYYFTGNYDLNLGITKEWQFMSD